MLVLQVLGGNGYISDYPTGRLLRDAKLYEIGAGTSEVRGVLAGRLQLLWWRGLSVPDTKGLLSLYMCGEWFAACKISSLFNKHEHGVAQTKYRRITLVRDCRHNRLPTKKSALVSFYVQIRRHLIGRELVRECRASM